MDVVLAGLDQHALPYIDDILIFSSSWEDHLIHMEGVMGRLKEARLTVKPGKCLWGRYNKRGECRTPNITNGKCIRKVT